MTRNRTSDENLLATMAKASWTLLILLSVAGYFIVSANFALSLLAGGLTALGNNFWLRNILERILIQQRSDAASYALIRFILRYTLLGAAILIALRLGANIAGLLVGLSVPVITTICFSIYIQLQHKGD